MPFISIFFMWQRQISLLLYELSVHLYVIGYTSLCFWSTCSISPENNFVSHLWLTFSLEITSWWSTTGYDGIIINMVSVTVVPVTEVASVSLFWRDSSQLGALLLLLIIVSSLYFMHAVLIYISLPSFPHRKKKSSIYY